MQTAGTLSRLRKREENTKNFGGGLSTQGQGDWDLFGEDKAACPRNTQHEGSKETFQRCGQNWSIKDPTGLQRNLPQSLGRPKLGPPCQKNSIPELGRGGWLSAVAPQGPASESQVAREKWAGVWLQYHREDRGGWIGICEATLCLLSCPSAFFSLLFPTSLCLSFPYPYFPFNWPWGGIEVD